MEMTTKQLAEIRRRNALGENDTMIAEALGVAISTAWKHRMRMGLPSNRHKQARNCFEYMVWDAKTDELLVCGSAKECAAYLGFAYHDLFYEMVSKVASGKNKKYHVEKVRLDNDATD